MNVTFPHVMYNHTKTLTMIPRLCSYFEIGTPVHEIMNDKWPGKFCCDV